MRPEKPRRRVYLSPPHMGGTELELIGEVFASNYIAPTGAMLDRFESSLSAYTGLPHVVALCSGTSAIHLALRLWNIGPGDEVWTSSLTFVGGAAPILYQGATPVFFDVSPDTWTIDVDLVEQELLRAIRAGRPPKAIITTDLYGQSADLDPVVKLARDRGIRVLSDSAEAMGTRYKDRHAGDGADAAAFSFNGNKIITTSGGGALASHDREFIEQARFLAAQARDRAPHYQHSTYGYNYRLSNVCAAIGVGQMKIIDERVNNCRTIFSRYFDNLANNPGISFMPEAPYGRSNRWLTVVLLDLASHGCPVDELRLALEAGNCESRPIWKPMHLQPLFRDARFIGQGVCDRLFQSGLCLPSGTDMTEREQDHVISIIRFFLHKPQVTNAT